MKTTKTASNEGKRAASPSWLIDARIKELGDWRGETLARVRMLIKQACPDCHYVIIEDRDERFL